MLVPVVVVVGCRVGGGGCLDGVGVGVGEDIGRCVVVRVR